MRGRGRVTEWRNEKEGIGDVKREERREEG